MAIIQLSTFVENKTGSLVECTRVLGEAGVDMRALSIADTRDFGILRFIATDTYKAVHALKDAGFVVKTNEVVGFIINDKPGALAEVIQALAEEKIDIKYMYAFVGKSNKHAYAVVRVDDTLHCEKVLKKMGVSVLDAHDVASM